MFGRFLKPRWQHANPDIRLKAIELLNPRDDAQILAQLSRGDASALVRAAAAGRLIELSLLDEIHQRDEAPSVREAASMRIMALLAGTTDDAPNQDTRLRLIRLTGNDDALRFIAENSPDDHCQQAAIERLRDPSALFRLAVDGRTEALRVSAAQQISDLPTLKRLAREGRDKRVVRLARDQARVLQEKEQAQEARNAKVVHLADRLEQHARRSADALYGPRLEQLEQQWQQHRDNATPDLSARVSQALQQCREQLNSRQEAHRLEALRDTARTERDASAHALYQLLSQSDSQTWEQQLGELRSALATQQRRWQSAHQQSPADENETRGFNDLVAAFEKMLSLASQALEAESADALLLLSQQWPSEYPRPSALMGIAEPAAASPKPDARKPRTTPHRGLLVALKRELSKGNLRHANRLWHKAESIAEEEKDSVLSKELAKLTERRAELQDWHRFAAQPKKEALCEKMEGLATTNDGMDPPELATAIQALHDEWRALMSSDQDEDQALWDRFKQATDQAYLPCQAHFAEQDALRQQNLIKRQELCQQLESFMANQSWENVDWEAIWQIRQQAPKDWKQLQPVRFTDNREVQKRFSALLSDLDDKLNHWIEQARSQRDGLIQQAQSLPIEDGQIQESVRQAQQLQKQWRTTGWVPPSVHRGMQKSFKRAMDRVFNERNRLHDAQKAQQSARLDEAQKALSQLESTLVAPFSRDNAKQLSASLSEIDTFSDLRLPRDMNRQLQQLRRRARERLDRMSEWEQWQAMQESLQALPTGDQCEEQDLVLAVAFEALAGVPSPEPERQRRLAWQLEALPAAMKRQGFAVLDEMARLLERHQGAVCANAKNRMHAALAVLEPGNG